MDKKQIEGIIKKKFRIKRDFDNLPYGTSRKYGRSLLPGLFYELGYTKGAEIGVRFGNFSIKLCEANPDLHLYCIDPWHAYNNKYTQRRQDRIYDQAVKNLRPYNVEIIKRKSIDALELFKDESLDFVFIDGDHHYDFVAPDIIYWSKKVRKNGIVACHDYYAFGWAGVMQAVNSYTFCHDIRPWYVTKEYEPTAFWVKP